MADVHFLWFLMFITGFNLIILGLNLKLYTEVMKEKSMRKRVEG